jgi:hypothetical protein
LAFTEALKYNRVEEDEDPNAAAPMASLDNEMDDYVRCEYCQRRFAPNVAERHIPNCKDARSRPKPIPAKSKKEKEN